MQITAILPVAGATLCFGALLSAQSIVDHFDFDDAADTLLQNATNSVGSGSWSEANWSTNGAGQLIIGTGAVAPLEIGFEQLTPSTFGTGLFTYEVTLAGWELDDVESANPSGSFRNFGIHLRDSTAGQNLIELQLNNRDSDRLRLRLTTQISGDYNNSVVTGFDDGDIPIVNPDTPYTLGISLDLSSGDYSAYVMTGGSTTVAGTGTYALGHLAGLDIVRMFAGNREWGQAGDYLAIESVSISAVPEPSALAALCALFAMGGLATRRRVR